MQFRPDSKSAPLHEPAVSRGPGWPEHGRDLRPRTPGRGHEDNRRQHLTVPMTAPTTTLRPSRRLWHHPLKQLPQSIRDQTLSQQHSTRLPTSPIEMISKETAG
jgi:hypothetical protein